MIKVLVVEALSVERELLIHLLSSDALIKVIGTIQNGIEALEAVHQLRPDVVVMGLHLPKISGLEVTRRIMETDPCPIVLVRGQHAAEIDSETYDAMGAGALAVLPCPVDSDSLGHEEARQTLLQTVKLMSEIKVVRRWPRRQQPSSIPRSLTVNPFVLPEKIHITVIGASTGGPSALCALLAGLPQSFPTPILIVQHMASGFIKGFTDWLQQCTSLPVRVAKHEDQLIAGHVYVAPDGYQMMVNRNGRISLTQDAPENGLRPSVSFLFRSAIEAYGSETMAILLSGMGRDGAVELARLKEGGAITFAQDKASSIVHGMPGEAIKLDAARYILPPEEMAEVLVKLVSRVGNDVKGVGQ